MAGPAIIAALATTEATAITGEPTTITAMDLVTRTIALIPTGNMRTTDLTHILLRGLPLQVLALQ